MIILTKKFKFSAAHRYQNPRWSEEENLAAFGDDSRLHGHNYELEVSLTGEVDPDTGFLADLDLIKALVQEHVLDLLDHAHIEADIPWFAERQPTTENIVRYIWEQLSPRITDDVRLTRIRLYETPTIYAEFDGRAGESQPHQGDIQ